MSQPIKCRAAILVEEGKPLVIEETLIDPPKDDLVLVKMVAAGICASDGHYVWGQQKLAEHAQMLPSVLGHEGSGIVESVGDKVNDLEPGDHVLTTLLGECRKCDLCSNPDTNFCLNNLTSNSAAFPVRKRLDGSSVYPLLGVGAFAEYILIRRSQVVKITKDVDLEKATVISCSVQTGFFAAVNQAKVKPGTTCAVWGLGAIGLNTIQGCKYNGAKNIIGIDINPDKRTKAIEFGCTEFVNPKELDIPVDQYLMEKYQGANHVFDCFGGSQMIIDQALNSLTPVGTFVMVGIPSTETKITYSALNLLWDRKIIGGLLGAKKCSEGFPELISLYQDKKIKVDELITNWFSFDQINEAFETLKNGKCIRSLIRF